MEDPARRRTRDLVMALRPSIARRCGVHTSAVDTLTDAGLLAWRVAMRQLVADLPSDDRVTGWAANELLAESSRWQDGAVVLGLVNQWINGSAGLTSAAELGAVAANVAALRQRVRRGQAAISERDVRRAITAHAHCSASHGSLAAELASLVNLGATAPLPYRCSRPATPLVGAAGVRALHAVFAPDRVPAVMHPKVAS
jgi:hypothetical protein